MHFIRDTVVEVRKGYETQFNMLQKMVCNMNAIGQTEDALKVIKDQKKAIKKHKLQQKLLSTFVIIPDNLHASSEESVSYGGSLVT
jgi:hypothetical protein